jgi:hypothetical protein
MEPGFLGKDAMHVEQFKYLLHAIAAEVSNMNIVSIKKSLPSVETRTRKLISLRKYP